MKHVDKKEGRSRDSVQVGGREVRDVSMGRSNTEQMTRRSAMSLHVADRHKRISKMLGFCLTLATPEAWCGLVPVLMARLTANERKWLACMALHALDQSDAEQVASDVLPAQGAGSPLAALDDIVSEAEFWADMADASEIDAYCLTCFNRMPANRQDEFLSYIASKRERPTKPTSTMREAA